MDNLLHEICTKNNVNIKYVKEIIETEKRHVHKKRRTITGDLKEVLEKMISSGEIKINDSTED